MHGGFRIPDQLRSMTAMLWVDRNADANLHEQLADRRQAEWRRKDLNELTDELIRPPDDFDVMENHHKLVSALPAEDVVRSHLSLQTLCDGN
ncbi:hypothetical protein D3C87_1802990 [compost metagenome]